MTDSDIPASASKSSEHAEQKVATKSEAAKVEASHKLSSANAATSAPIKQNSGAGRGLSVFAILVSLIALAASGLTWYQNQVVQVKQESKLSVGVSEIGGQVSRLGDSVARLQSDQANVISQSQLSTASLQIETKLGNQLRTLGEQQAALANQQLVFADALNDINSKQQGGVNQYAVDETAQLLRLANNSVLFAGDVNSAINALGLADAQLKSLVDPRYSTVRSQILKEINALQNVQLPDIEALSARLQGLAQLVPSLPLENEPESLTKTVEAAPVEQQLTWRTELKKVWRDMLNSVQIQRVDQPPKPLLAPEQRYFLDQNLILTIEKAELAMIQGRPALFKQTIEKAVTWLTEYFDLQDAKVQSVLQQLNALAAQPLKSEMPDISGSYQALQSIQGGQ